MTFQEASGFMLIQATTPTNVSKVVSVPQLLMHLMGSDPRNADFIYYELGEDWEKTVQICRGLQIAR